MLQTKLDFLDKRKITIDTYLLKILETYSSEFSRHSQSEFIFSYLSDFVQSGKTIRGALFLEALAQLNAQVNLKSQISIAAAIELIHSALLIQDDYMDQDTLRRSIPALHSELLEKATHNAYRKPHIYAPSAVMCVTDICFFIAFSQIASATNDKSAAAFSYIAHEYSHVGFAQWKDVELANKVGHEYLFTDLEQVYKYKTARYTFVAPVHIAAIIAETDSKTIVQLDAILEIIGMVFQIRDDYLSLFGDEKYTGKPVGGDIIEDKKTIFQFYLVKEILKEKNHKYRHLLDYFGNNKLTLEQITELKEAITLLGIDSKIAEVNAQYEAVFLEKIKMIQVTDSFKEILKELFLFAMHRNK